MKVYLKAYSEEAANVLREAFWYMSSQLVKRGFVRREADNEIVFFDESSNVSEATVRRQLSRALTAYKNSNLVCSGAPDKDEEARKIECLRLIILEKDEKAKKLYPAEYAALKGKPLDPIKTAAVETLIRMIDETIKKAEASKHALKTDKWKKLKKDLESLSFKLIELRGLPLSLSDIC